MASVNEVSTQTWTVTPYDENGTNVAPTNARYRLDDKASGSSIISWTTLTPSTSMEIVLPASAHQLVDAEKSEETKVLTVEVNYGLDSAHVEEFEYEVIALQFVS